MSDQEPTLDPEFIAHIDSGIHTVRRPQTGEVYEAFSIDHLVQCLIRAHNNAERGGSPFNLEARVAAAMGEVFDRLMGPDTPPPERAQEQAGNAEGKSEVAGEAETEKTGAELKVEDVKAADVNKAQEEKAKEQASATKKVFEDTEGGEAKETDTAMKVEDGEEVEADKTENGENDKAGEGKADDEHTE